MPIVEFDGKSIDCEIGENLRQVLVDHNLALHNGSSKIFNCRGLGTCGTCSVKINGKVSKMTTVEKTRLSFPPHCISRGLRLACQIKVLGNLKVEKGAGFWGQEI
ncbi:MAG: (2Fe-2S)-binding protein [Bacteroidetes bacterium]|jgi:ferredoxin|nr:(2Fe-2S)-binding protein [Bacteroidota bacterium]